MDLKDVLKNIEKKYGKEAIAGKIADIETISTGSLVLDDALGGGIAKGRLTEIYGTNGSSKTTLAFSICAQVQKLGKKVAYIDMEQSVDLFYAANIGVNVDIEKKDPTFYLSQPGSAEAGLEIIREFIKSPDIGIVVLDSVAALVPKAVIDGEAGDAKIGLTARLLSSMIPTMLSTAKNNGTILLFINQIRDSIGFFSGTTTPGGHALKFYSSQRIELARIGNVKGKDEEVHSIKVKAKVVKNKIAPPFRNCQYTVRFGEGIDGVKELIDIAIDYNIISKKGAGWFTYGDTKLGQGEENLINLFKDTPELYEEIQNKINEHVRK